MMWASELRPMNHTSRSKGRPIQALAIVQLAAAFVSCEIFVQHDQG